VFKCRNYYAQVLEERFERRGVREEAFTNKPVAKKYKPVPEESSSFFGGIKQGLGFGGAKTGNAVDSPIKGGDVGYSNKGGGGGASGRFVDIEPAGIVWGNGNTASKLTAAEQIALDEARRCRLTLSNPC